MCLSLSNLPPTGICDQSLGVFLRFLPTASLWEQLAGASPRLLPTTGVLAQGLGKSYFTDFLCMYATGISGHQAAKLLRANGGKMAKLTIFMEFDFTKGPERGPNTTRGW